MHIEVVTYLQVHAYRVKLHHRMRMIGWFNLNRSNEHTPSTFGCLDKAVTVVG